jgi:hypothetical protein
VVIVKLPEVSLLAVQSTTLGAIFEPANHLLVMTSALLLVSGSNEMTHLYVESLGLIVGVC